MRTNGRTSSWGGGASMRTAVSPFRLTRSYLRNEASPARCRRSPSPHPWARKNAPMTASRPLDIVPHTRDARSPASVAGHPGGAARAGHGQLDLEPARRQVAPKALRPFDQQDPAAQCVLQSQLDDVVRLFQAIEIEVPNVGRVGLVSLNQRERR